MGVEVEKWPFAALTVPPVPENVMIVPAEAGASDKAQMATTTPKTENRVRRMMASLRVRLIAQHSALLVPSLQSANSGITRLDLRNAV
jgi:hypothetical protein